MGTEVQIGDIAVISSRVSWRVENFSKLNKMHFSDTFLIGCNRWRLLIYPKGASGDYLSVYLCAVGFSNCPSANFALGVINQIDNTNTIRKGAHCQFTEQDRSRGFASLMPLDELNDPSKGYIVNDTCILEAEVSMPEVAEYQLLNSLEGHTDNPMDLEQRVGVLVKSVTSTEDIYPVVAPNHISEPVGVVEAVAEVAVSNAAKQDKFPGAGLIYEEGKQPDGVFVDEKFEDVGGFSVLKTQASLYKEIWLSYGHIASSQVLRNLYSSQVAVVSDIMTSIVEMNRCSLEEVSSELINSWEEKIKVAEKLEFNIGWLRERFEDIKKIFAGEKKLQEALTEQVQAKAQVIKAEQQLGLANDRVNMAKAQVIEAEQQLVLANYRLNMAKTQVNALETKISPLRMERQNFLKKCSSHSLLFDCGMSSSLVMLVEEAVDNYNSVPSTVENDAMLVEEPVNNNNSKTVPSTGIAASVPRRTRTITTSISPARGAKRQFAGDGAVGGVGHHSEKIPKIFKDGCAAKSQSITDRPMPSRASLSPEIGSTSNAQQLFTPRASLSPEIGSTSNAQQLFTEDEIKAVLLQHPILTTKDLVAKFRSRLNTREEKVAFADTMKGICGIQTKEDGIRYVILIKK